MAPAGTTETVMLSDISIREGVSLRPLDQETLAIYNAFRLTESNTPNTPNPRGGLRADGPELVAPPTSEIGVFDHLRESPQGTPGVWRDRSDRGDLDPSSSNGVRPLRAGWTRPRSMQPRPIRLTARLSPAPSGMRQSSACWR